MDKALIDQTPAVPEPRLVLIHGFGEYAVIYSHLMKIAAAEAPHLSFGAILTTSHHRDLVAQSVPEERLLCLEERLQRLPPPVGDISDLANYHGNIYLDVEAEKKTFKHRSAAFQTARAIEIYRLYKGFVQRLAPDHVLLSHVEGFEQKMLESLCHELQIPVSVPTDLRTIGGSFLSPDTQETMPDHRPVTPELLEKARVFVDEFRQAHKPPVVAGLPAELWGARLDRHVRPFRQRLTDFIRRGLKHPDQFEWDFLRAAALNNLPFLRDLWWRLRGWRAGRWHDVEAVDQLPEKFVYYPLQVTPESSINTPAPYYVDQLRVVDALRMAMPSDHMLVVKDHWASIVVRRKSLMDAIRKRAGVVVIRHDVHGRELIKRASVTVSVTGTSTLEAYLLGRPSLTLGGMFASRYLGGVVGLSEIRTRLSAAIDRPPPDEEVVKGVAEMMSVASPFSIFGLALPGDPVYTEGNIREFLCVLLGEIEKKAVMKKQ